MRMRSQKEEDFREATYQYVVRSQREVFSAYLGTFYVLVPTESGRLALLRDHGDDNS